MSIYAVLSALYGMYDGISTDLPVHRGKYVTDPDADFLSVGWAPNTPTAVTGLLAFTTEDNVFRSDDFTVINYVETWTGDTDNASIQAREQRLFAYWDQIQTLHLANRTLNGSCGYAELGRYDLIPDETAAGFVAGLVFNVNVHALV